MENAGGYASPVVRNTSSSIVASAKTNSASRNCQRTGPSQSQMPNRLITTELVSIKTASANPQITSLSSTVASAAIEPPSTANATAAKKRSGFGQPAAP